VRLHGARELQHFGTAEVSRLTKVPVRSIRSMVQARYVSPEKGARGALQFSFHDLVLLRTGRGLLAAGIPARRVGEALRAVRAQLPEQLPKRGLSVTSAGGRVVVHEAGKQRDALSGQLLMAFEVRRDGDSVQLVDIPVRADEPGAGSDECERAFSDALDMEDQDIDGAMEAYRACVARHSHSGARANLGRLLHLQGRISEALKLYREGDQSNVDLLYNQAVALDDLGRVEEAIAAYMRVLELDRDHPEAHHNVARLWQQAGDNRRALRHWNTYRKLSRGEAG
jgi:tetratricopeptide (TPR) repeat protein